MLLDRFFGQEDEPFELLRVECGGKIEAETDVKLACKTVFASIFTSDGHPMLLDRFFGQEDEPFELLRVEDYILTGYRQPAKTMLE